MTIKIILQINKRGANKFPQPETHKHSKRTQIFTSNNYIISKPLCHRNLQFSSAFSFEFNFKFLHCLLYSHRYCSRFDSIHSICSRRLIYELKKPYFMQFWCFNCPLFPLNSRCFFHVAVLIFCCHDLILMHIVFTITVPIPIPTPITIIHWLLLCFDFLLAA